MQGRNKPPRQLQAGEGGLGPWVWAWVARTRRTFGRARRKSRQALLISIPCFPSGLIALLISSHPVTRRPVPPHPAAVSVYHPRQADGELLRLGYDL